MLNIEAYMAFWAKKVDTFLNNYIRVDKCNSGLIDSMKYSLFAGGKRLRPILIYSSYALFDNNFEKVTPFAAAVEMVHTYSLIHDDLPAMDNDDFRRGKPTNHKVFGESIAILAGDALLTKAFSLMLDRDVNNEVEPEVLLEAAYNLSLAVGENGMIAGQYLDVTFNINQHNAADLVYDIHKRKTAMLIAYCLELGAILGYSTDIDRNNLKDFGERIGFAFQIIDDILDIEAAGEELGKDTGKDKSLNKITYPAVYGIEEAKRKAKELVDEAIEKIAFYGDAAAPLIALANYIVTRSK
jgi:geranylgeranyl diphosphate synthase type II